MKFTLKASLRDGKKTAQALRKDGFIPVELYGHGVENVHLAVVRGELEKVWKQAGATSVVEVDVDGKETRPVLLHDIKRHYMTDELEHADFYQVNLKEKTTASVPLKMVGDSKAVRVLGGILVELIREVEVECLPQDIPHELEVDLSLLSTFEDMITASQIKLPANVTLVTDGEEAVAKVQEPRDLEKELAETTEVKSAADVEVEKKGGKKEEEAAE
jgi:large subunit ribosomal protein L25